MDNPTISLSDVLRDQPKFHRLVDIHPELNDELTSWAARISTLESMRVLLQPHMRTLETGCGHSTVMFALAGVEHHCVTVAAAETERVRAFCSEWGIDTSRIRFLIGDSVRILPTLDETLQLDLAFIDGGHFFPMPCFDWYYTDLHLREGGTLVIDDVRIPTVAILYNFLMADANWERMSLIDDTAFFRKIRHAPNLHDWIEQRFNCSYPDWSFLRPGEGPRALHSRIPPRIRRLFRRLWHR